MIDYQNEVFTNVATEIRSKHDGVTIAGEYMRSPSEFPMVTVEEIDNVTVDSLVDSSDVETYAGIGYRVQVFSNKVGGKKAEARAIFATADNVMRGMGFRRITYSTTPEIYESTIYSITATYDAVVDVRGSIYKR